MNPAVVIAMLKNESKGTFHPIMYQFHPAPGDITIPRYKSLGHHTTGFPTIEEATTECHNLVKKCSEIYGTTVLSLKKGFIWDGKETPASVTLFTEQDYDKSN